MDNLKYMRYADPTPIQSHGIPIIMSHRDMMACAQTGTSHQEYTHGRLANKLYIYIGSGKTATYIIPVVNKMLRKGKEVYTHNITRGGGRSVAGTSFQ
jgi:ATP-dependent RNA helicase DDX3X